MLTKMVDGVEEVMSAEEEAAIVAEWAENSAREKPVRERPVDAIIRDPLQLAALKAALAK